MSSAGLHQEAPSQYQMAAEERGGEGMKLDAYQMHQMQAAAMLARGFNSVDVDSVGPAPPTPVSQSSSDSPVGEEQRQREEVRKPQVHSTMLPVHTVHPHMYNNGFTFPMPPMHATAPVPAQAFAAAPAPQPQQQQQQQQAAPIEQAQPVTQEEEIQDEEEAPKKRTRRGKERIRRIHLPVREGMEDLSSSEGSGSDWDEVKPAEGTKLPPGYTGRRRVKKPTDGKIKPSYYYPTEGNTRGVPVFEPTYEEFKDFNSFINKIDNYGMRSGIVKIVPPKEWHESLVSVSQPLKDTIVRDAIEQNFMGSQGLFKQSNISSRRLYNVKQWKELCDTDKYRTPDFFNAEKKNNARGEDFEAPPRKKGPAKGAAARAAKRAAALKKKEEEEQGTPAPSEANENVIMDDHDAPKDQPIETVKAENVITKVTAPPSPATSSEDQQQDQRVEAIDTIATEGSSPDQPSNAVPETPAKDTITVKAETAAVGEASTKKRRRGREEDQDNWDEEWAKFDYTSLPHGASPDDYTVEECHKIEKHYWRNFMFGAPPMYGADGSGSLFDESNKEWNVAALDDLLMRINPHMPMPGVNTPYLYFGMWRATFSWHVEDADLYSINHLHFGAPKFWYSVPQAHAERFERVMASYFQRDRQKCPEFLRHKSYLVSPQKLAKDGIPLNRVVQFPGEIILTYPYGYHSGFNIGFNCAESINFATEGWLDIGRKAEACVCVADSVRIDVDKWLEEAREDAERIRSDPVYAEQRKQERELAVVIPQHEAKRRRIMGPDYVERKQRSAIQPRMQAKPSKAPVPPLAKDENVKPATAQQPALQGPSYAQLQASIQGKPGQQPFAAPYSQAQIGVPAHLVKPAPVSSDLKPVNLQRLPPANPAKVAYPCALCPEESTEGLVRIVNPGAKHKNKTLFAHKICVTFTPTTWVAPDVQTGEEVVYGFELIEKERWNLKCGLCSERHGTKIQCTKSQKCVRAFHATCAIKDDSGVVLDALVGGKSVLDPNQDPQHTQQVTVNDDGQLHLVVACRQHNPAWMKQQADKRKTELSNRVAALPIGYQIQIRATTGIYGVTVVGHRAEQAAVEIAFGDGTRALCKHGAIVWPEEVAKMQKNEKPQAQQAVPQPRVHPMERSRSGQTTQNQPQNHLTAMQAAHPYPQPPAQQPLHQYSNQQPQQHGYYAQQTYQSQATYPAPPQSQRQFSSPQVQQYQQPHQQYPQYQQPPSQKVPYDQPYSQMQYPQPVPVHLHENARHQQPASVPSQQAPAQQAFGFVPQPIPYYNGKTVHFNPQSHKLPAA